jgi:hypothetical protein
MSLILTFMKLIKYYHLQILSLAILTLVAGCTKKLTDTSSLYVPTAANATANATLLELQQGRTLYINNCNTCHALFLPDNYSPSQWRTIMSSMAPRTNMSASESILVTKYVSKGN